MGVRDLEMECDVSASFQTVWFHGWCPFSSSPIPVLVSAPVQGDMTSIPVSS